MFENLELIKELERQRLEILQIQRSMSEPLLNDVAYIKTIYDTIGNIPTVSRSEHRQIFILIVLLFYSPKKLVVGTKINEKVMREMCNVTDCSQPLLSHCSRNLIFFYQHYKHFREAADDAMDRVEKKLEDCGLSKDRIRDYMWKYKNK